jgi:hypothetical protein
VLGNHQKAEEFFTVKSNRTKGSQSKKEEKNEALYQNLFDFPGFAVNFFQGMLPLRKLWC